LSERSHCGYRRIRWFTRRLLHKIDLFAVQTDAYARRLLDLGASPARVAVTGSVKFDGVQDNRDNLKTYQLRQALGLERSEAMSPLVWVVGSTQDPEEAAALAIYRQAKPTFPQLRLILVPRHPERFEAVAKFLAASGLPFMRRSHMTQERTGRDAVILVDTVGELGAVWGLADVGFVGGSLVPRGGQNMIEPAAYGVAVTFGPHVWNFRDTVDRLLEHEAAVQVADAAALERETLRLFGDTAARQRLGQNAQQFVRSQFGATDRTIDLLAPFLTATAHAGAEAA
jgi:3-deoxy-D-manno-octulosonic-acid transferase